MCDVGASCRFALCWHFASAALAFTHTHGILCNLSRGAINESKKVQPAKKNKKIPAVHRITASSPEHNASLQRLCKVMHQLPIHPLPNSTKNAPE
jgi:hypothetical protein